MKGNKGLDALEGLKSEVGVLLVAGFEAQINWYDENKDKKPAATQTGKKFGNANVITITSPEPDERGPNRAGQ